MFLNILKISALIVHKMFLIIIVSASIISIRTNCYLGLQVGNIILNKKDLKQTCTCTALNVILL